MSTTQGSNVDWILEETDGQSCDVDDDILCVDCRRKALEVWKAVDGRNDDEAGSSDGSKRESLATNDTCRRMMAHS